MSSQLLLSSQEQNILMRLGGTPWQASRYSEGTVKSAAGLLSDLRLAAGFKTGSGRWLTTEATNSKFGKSSIPTAGLTLHAARGALTAWRALEPAAKASVAAVLGESEDAVVEVLGASVCPRSTVGCRATCVAAHSANAILASSQRSRLVKTLLTLLAPESAVLLTAHALRQMADLHGRNGARWRVNVADDLRWEMLAPGLWDRSPASYTYSKYSPAKRPGLRKLRIVYSASETWSVERITRTCEAGHRVALILDLPKKEALPASWMGVPVVDGDKTDDLWQHPAGVIVGLRSKAPTKAMKQAMLISGFARTARPSGQLVTVR